MCILKWCLLRRQFFVIRRREYAIVYLESKAIVLNIILIHISIYVRNPKENIVLSNTISISIKITIIIYKKLNFTLVIFSLDA